MKTKGSWELVWIAIAMGAVLTSLIIVVYRKAGDPRLLNDLKSQRIALVNNMRLALAAASEEQNCAVMSTSEQASKAFIEKSIVELTSFERSKRELEKLEPAQATEIESSLHDRVNDTFREFQSVSERLSRLALQSSNRKAYALAFGPVMDLLKSIDKEFALLAAEQEGKQDQASLEILRTINNVRRSELRIQVYLLPHIAEPSDQRMDELEKMIAQEDEIIRDGLLSLSSSLNTSAEIEKIRSLYNEFKEIESKVIALSRENSDIRSVEIVLNEKRKSVLACQDALADLEKAIRAEPIESAIPKGRSQ